MSKKKGSAASRAIAVVEEIADNIYSIKFILQSLGFAVRSFALHSQDLTDLVKFAPGLIIIDMMMAAGEGYEIIRRIQASSELAAVPILAITAEAMQGTESDVLAAGARDVLPKPYAVTDLKEKLNRWLPGSLASARPAGG